MTDIALPQGAIKSSEVSLDLVLDIIQSNIGADGMTALTQILGVAGDAARKTAYILNSNGSVIWDGTNLTFNNGITGTNVVLRLLQPNPSGPMVVDLTMAGSTSAPSPTTFQSIPLANNDLLYIEIDRATLLASAGVLTVQNAVNGGSGTSPVTLHKVNMSSSSGMPALTNAANGATQTLYIPLACKLNGTTDLYWIPHGIRWPAGTSTTLGAIIESGLETWPDYYVSSEAQLVAAVTALSSSGGVICVDAGFTIDTTIPIPANTILVGRGFTRSILTIAATGLITLGNHSELRCLSILCSAAFAGAADQDMVRITGAQAIVRDCYMEPQNTGVSHAASCINVQGNDARVINTEFHNTTGSAYRNGINASGAVTGYQEIMVRFT